MSVLQKCPLGCGRYLVTKSSALGVEILGCPCVPNGYAVAFTAPRSSSFTCNAIALPAAEGEMLCFLRTEHDPGDEDLRGCDEFRVLTL